ncbi:MAG: LysR family transcriptional regulator [Woeseiaceae bacterium]|nr:LysR family transcriptional regulator [Woeseiaceae bacterium]
MSGISLKHARLLLAAARHSSVTGAATAINRSQTSVTKSLHDLEADVGVELFDRSAKGITLTAYGKALAEGAGLARDAFARAREAIPPATISATPSVGRFFEMDVSDRWLDAFIAVAEHQDTEAAADGLGITVAAILVNIRKLEDMLHQPLFDRLPNATVPTAFATTLVSEIKLARMHLRHAVQEINAMQGVQSGRIRFGSLPFSRTFILPTAIKRLLRKHPDINVTTVEAPYAELLAALRCGDVDFIVTALDTNELDSSLTCEALIDNRVSIVVRTGHPLTKIENPSWSDLAGYDWVVPNEDSPTRHLFEDALAEHEYELPRKIVETGSLLITRGLLEDTDMVTVLSEHQIHYEQKLDLLTTVDLPIFDKTRPIGIIRRAQGSMLPASEVLLDEIREAAREVGPAV